MDTKSIINLLFQKFDFSKSQRDILEFLATQDATAEAILKNTKVSSGRVYPTLKKLQSLGLVERITTDPAIYSLRNFPTNVRQFLNISFTDFVNRQQDVSQALEDKSQVETEIFDVSKTEADARIEKMLTESGSMKILHKHVSYPWFLYPEDEAEFLRLRYAIAQRRMVGSVNEKEDLLKKLRTYNQLYKSKPVEHLMLKSTLDDYFQLLQKLNIDFDLKAKLARYPNVKIMVLDRLHTPFSTYISDKKVLMPMFFENKRSRILELSGAEAVTTYADYFDEHTKEAHTI